MQGWSLTATDLDELRELSNASMEERGRWALDYVQTERGRFEARFEGLAPLPGEHADSEYLQPARQRYGRRLHIRGAAPSSAWGFVFPLNDVPFSSQHAPLKRGQVLVLSPGEELSAVSGPGVELLECNVEAALFEEMREELGRQLQPGILQLAPEPLGRFLRGVDTAFGSGTEANRLAASDGFASLLGSATSARRTDGPSQRRRVLRAALEFLEANLHRPVTTREICRATGAHRRTLEYAFREGTGGGPIAYHHFARMQMARGELLRSEPGGCSVSRTALAWGFAHQGRFSVDYRRLFGESPSSTLARIPGRDRARQAGR